MTKINSLLNNINFLPRLGYTLSLVIAAAAFTACDDDDDDKKTPSVEGTWQGTQVDYSFKLDGVPTPIEDSDTDFEGVVEFKSNGKAVFTEDGDVTNGTWSQAGDKLTLSIPADSEEEDLSGVYTIKEINAAKLKLYIEKEGSFYDPETELDLEGTIKLTLYFDKD